MQDFIQMAVSKLDISETQAGSATGAVLQLIQKHADGSDVQQLLGKVPGAQDVLAKAPVAGGTGGGGLGGALGGGLGGLMSQASSMLGGGGGALGVLASLQQSGLEPGKIAQFVPMLLTFLKEKAGPDLLGKILGKVPELAKLAG